MKLVRLEEVVLIDESLNDTEDYGPYQEVYVNPDKVYMVKPTSRSAAHSLVIFDADDNIRKAEDTYLTVEGSPDQVAQLLAQ
jgi:hypothetical protein